MRVGLVAGLLVLGSVAACGAQTVTEITLPGSRLYTESITSLKDGTLIIGSMGKGTVSKIKYNSTDVTEWIHPGTNGMHAVFGVYADEPHNTLYVCSNKNDAGEGTAELKTFDLKSGAPKGSYALAGSGPFCNDTAVATDGTAYVADTRTNVLLMLKPGAKELVVASDDPLMKGIDGVAFGDKNVLYANSVTLGKMMRIEIGADGKATKVTELKLSRPLQGPDGLRTIGKNKLLQAENKTGVMAIVTVKGDDAEIQTIKDGMPSTPAVTATKGMAWVAEGKLNYRSDPTLKDKSPDPFKLYAVPLPK